MINLENKSGLDVSLENEEIIATENVHLDEPGLRRLSDFEKVVKDKDLELTDEVAYSMYRGPYMEKDKDLFEGSEYRYDITVVSSSPVGEEKMKTVGHYHPMKNELNVSFPEIYEVIHGEAHYLLQKEQNGSIVDVFIVHAKAGDKVVIPPNYGHVTINPIEETLVMTNVVEKNFASSYTEFEAKRGAIFYELTNGEIVKNENYSENFEPRIIEARDAKDIFGVQNDVPMYADFVNNPDKYDFLLNPEKYLEEFSKIYS